MRILKSLIRHVYINIGGPPRFDVLRKYMINKKINLLDVGCGIESPNNTKHRFPECKYYGIDVYDVFSGKDKNDMKIEAFWILNLETSNLNEIPNNFFDIIILTQVIEHLTNGEEVLLKLTQKLKSQGIFYIEFPSYHTMYLPSLKNKGVTFNFFDDKTHKKLYRKSEIANFLGQNQYKLIKVKTYINWKKIILFPFLIILHYLKDKREYLYELWWLVGWCSYVLLVKK